MIHLMQFRYKLMVAAGMAGIVFCTVIFAFPIGAPGRLSGGPGEQDCTNCHFGQLSDTLPKLVLDGIPDKVRAGTRQVFTLTLTHPDMMSAGIQTVVRPVSEEQSAVGQLESTQLSTLIKDGLTYLNHDQPVPAESGMVTLTFEWIIPATSGTAILNAAMVAANNDGSPFGDSVVKLERTIEIISD